MLGTRTEPDDPVRGGDVFLYELRREARVRRRDAGDGVPYCSAKQAIAPAGAGGERRPRGAALEEGCEWRPGATGRPSRPSSARTAARRCTSARASGRARARSAARRRCSRPRRATRRSVRGGLLPFRVPKDEANKRFGAWLGGLWFRPGDLKKIAHVEEMGGVYVPFWTFDAQVCSRWTAERGYYYYETERYEETENGQTVQRSRQVQRTRWEWARARGATSSTTCSSSPGARSPRSSWGSCRPSTPSSSCLTSRSSSAGGAPSSTRSTCPRRSTSPSRRWRACRRVGAAPTWAGTRTGG